MRISLQLIDFDKTYLKTGFHSRLLSKLKACLNYQLYNFVLNFSIYCKKKAKEKESIFIGDLW